MASDRKPNGQFLPGNGGRQHGSRNRLQADFINALADDFKANGEGVIRIVRVEKPVEWLKIIAGVLPKEFFMSEESPAAALSDDELAQVIAFARAGKKDAA
jgi:hypothetical protein